VIVQTTIPPGVPADPLFCDGRPSFAVSIVMCPSSSPIASIAFFIILIKIWQSLGVFPLMRLFSALNVRIMVIFLFLYWLYSTLRASSIGVWISTSSFVSSLWRDASRRLFTISRARRNSLNEKARSSRSSSFSFR
jgi:hypothetical protein